MAVIKLTAFGGLRPRDSARALPDDASQTATSLSPTTNEFRPLAADTTVVSASGVNNPPTIYRMQLKSDGSLNTDFTSAATWKITSTPRSYVRSQVNSDTTERTYVTIDDGSAAPRVIDATGSDRQLGVPAPTTAPTVVVNVSDEFTTEERSSSIEAALQTAIAAVKSNASVSWVGATHPGTGTTGVVDQSTSYGFTLDDSAKQGRLYRLDGASGSITDTYGGADASVMSWIFDPLLGGGTGQSTGTPSWAGTAGTWHWALTYTAYAPVFTLNSGSISTALEAIAMPGTTDGTKLLTGDQADEIVAALEDYVDQTGDILKPRIDALKNAVASLRIMLDGGAQGALANAMDDFYAQADVAAAITAAKSNFCKAVWNAAYLVAHSTTPNTDLGGTGL